MSIRIKTKGGVSHHAVQRLVKQYGFCGSPKEARSFLRGICRGEKTNRVEIPSRLLKKYGVVHNKKLFAVISFGVVENVFEASNF